MNANTAIKINEAIDQAIRCGESVEIVQLQVRNALTRAVEVRAAEQLRLVREETCT